MRRVHRVLPIAVLRQELIASGITRIGNVVPVAAVGGPIAALRDDDIVSFDIEGRRLDVELTDKLISARLSEWRAPAPRYQTGVMAKYAALVSSASRGALTDPRGLS